MLFTMIILAEVGSVVQSLKVGESQKGVIVLQEGKSRDCG